jgi:hypothetical protein
MMKKNTFLRRQTLVLAALLLWPTCQPCDRASDPCCGDPCCGDPCCGDPSCGSTCVDACCGDPCCGDPCCGDPCCGDPCCGDPCCGGVCSIHTASLAAKTHSKFTSVKDRAAYNLSCSADQISLESTADSGVRAKGCGKMVTYQCACPGGGTSTCAAPTCRAEPVAVTAAPTN